MSVRVVFPLYVVFEVTDDGYLTTHASIVRWNFRGVGKVLDTRIPFYIGLEWPGYCIGRDVDSDVGCDVGCDVGKDVGNVDRDVDVVGVAGSGAEEVFSLACIRPPSIPPISVSAVA